MDDDFMDDQDYGLVRCFTSLLFHICEVLRMRGANIHSAHGNSFYRNIRMIQPVNQM